MKTQWLKAAQLAALALSFSAPAAELNSLRALSVVPTPQGAQITVAGSRPPTFTVFRMSDPDRLVLDLSSANAQAIAGHHEGTGPVAGIVVSQFSDERQNVGRVMVALKDVSRYDVKTEGSRVVVAVQSTLPQGSPRTKGTLEERPSVESSGLEGQGEGGATRLTNLVSTHKDERPVGHPAHRVSQISLRADRLAILADGELSHFEVLELADPPRLAVDLYGVSTSARVPRPTGAIRELRVGVHADKIRLVMDVRGAMPPWQAERTARGMELLLGKAAEVKKLASAHLENAKKSPPQAEPEAEIDGQKVSLASLASEVAPLKVKKDKNALAEIHDVIFDDAPEGGRLRIKLSGNPTWAVERPEPRGAVLTLRGAFLPKRLERTLDTSALDTTVKMVSAFSVPGEDAKVRFVVSASSAFDGSVEKVDRTRDGMVWSLTAADKKNEQAISEVKTAPFSTEAVVPKAIEGQAGHRYVGKLVTFEFKDIDIHNLLRVIAEVSKKNVVVADDVTGRVTIRLRNVPWDQALDLVLRSKGLGKEEFGNSIIRVAPLKTLEEEAKMRAEQEKSRRILEPLVVQLIPVNYANADAMSARVKDILSERGNVSVDARTNVLVVRDVASYIGKARSLVQTLDTQTPQVLIESRIVEASTNFSRQIGVQWGGNAQAAPSTNNATGLIFPNTISTTGGAGQTPSQGTADTPNFAVNLPAATGTNIGGALGFVFGSAGGAVNLNLRLSALENQGTVKTISAPKVTTLDNVTARISQGVSIPFSQASAQGVNTTFVEARLQLEVTPHITLDGSVMMNIRAENNQPDPSNTGANGQPAIQRKEATTQVLVKDGDTTVIGGIYVRSGGSQVSGIPFLSRIPLLGFFFRRTTETDNRQELLIFITPRIINRQTMAQTL